ncbi:MAG: 30S ribosomal protein S6, partial [Thermodesulfobacteriota bacterium]
WAQRELAYEIKNYTRGVYYIMIFKALPGVVAELEKHLRFYNSDVLR